MFHHAIKDLKSASTTDLLRITNLGITFLYLFCFHQEEKELLNEYKTLATSLNKRAKSIIQLKPRNPTTSIKGKLPIQAVCDFKQQEVSKVLFPSKGSPN